MRRFLIFSTFFSQFLSQNTTELKLELVQAVWRHGDRAALADLWPIREQNWTFGGGGFGELTPVGMAQLNRLGGMLRSRYVTEMEFLSSRYVAKEIHIRSTNVNRTIVSAMSLAYGLFPAGAWNIQGVDYPTSINWTQGFTFVPIHVDGEEKCAVTQTCATCQRLDELRELWARLPEVQTATDELQTVNRHIASLYNISETSDDFSMYQDTWKCQRLWFNDTLYRELPWYNEELYTKAEMAYAPFKRFFEGDFKNNSTVNGIDVALEVKTIQSGPMINEIYARGQEKLDCVRDADNCTSSTKPLKFYGYSAHDLNVHGLLVVLGIPDLVKTVDGWPDYSSAIVFEFYSNPSSAEQLFKVLYRDNADSELADVTALIPVCNGAHFCSMQNLHNVADFYRPEPDIQTLCQTPVDRTKIASFKFSFFIFSLNFVSLFVFISQF